MTAAERKRIEERLLEERQEAMEDARQLGVDVADDADNAGELSNYPQHPADEGSSTQEEEKDVMLLGKEGDRLYEIDEALRRLYRNPEIFGQCEECDGDIAVERLELIPWARYCAEHQNAREEEAV